MDKLSNAQVSQMMKMAAENLRALSEENAAKEATISELKEKVASYEKKDRAEKLAAEMEEKGLNTHLSHEEKVASLMKHDNLSVVEEAVSMSAPQMKIASVHSNETNLEQDYHGESAESVFAASLASLD